MCKLYLDTDGTTFLLDSTYSLKLLGDFTVEGDFTFGNASVDSLAITGYMTITTTTTAAGSFTGLNNVITCGLTHTGNVAGTRSYVTTDNTGDSIANMFGLVARASLTHASDVVTGTMTGLLAQIDMGSTANSNAANAWGICVNHIETGTRAKIPVAFIRFTDADFAGSAPTNYLFDCGGTGNEFPTGTGKIFYEHTLWTRVNGTDKYIVLSDSENCISLSGTIGATGISIGTCTTGISIGATTTAINISGTATGASGKAIKAYYTVNNANYGDAYSLVESDLTLTGTVAGMVSAFGSWVNMAAVTTGANYVCAQNNGLWSDTGGILTNGTFIFGMRAQCLLQTNGGASGAKFYPFCVVNNTNVTTAIFKCNAGSSDLGTTAVSKTTEGKYVPLYTDDAGTHYVLIYN